MRGMKPTSFLLFPALLACSGGPVATEPSPAELALMMKPGHWDTVVQIREIAAPAMAPQVVARTQQAMRRKLHTVSSCLSPEDARNVGAGFLGQGIGECSGGAFTMAGGKVSGTITCNSEEGTRTVTMDGSYGPDSYAMMMIAHTVGGAGPGANMTVTLAMEAKRSGACTGKEMQTN